MGRRFGAVIFDLDGVLVLGSELGVNAKALATVMEQRKWPLAPEELAFIPGRAYADVLPGFLKARGIEWDEECHRPIIDEAKGHYDLLWEENTHIAPFAKAVLTEFHLNKIPMAIGTMNRRCIVDRFVGRLGLGNIFQAIVVAKDVEPHYKPEPDVYVKAGKLLGVPWDDILVVEDTEVGILAAKAAGLACAAIRSESFFDHDHSQADIRITSLYQLIKHVGPRH